MTDTTIKVDSSVRDRLALLAAERSTTIRQLVEDLVGTLATAEEQHALHVKAIDYVRQHLNPDFDASGEAVGAHLWDEIGRLQHGPSAEKHDAA